MHPASAARSDLRILYATVFGGFFFFGTFFPVVPAHLRELGMSPAQVGYAATCLQLSFSVFQGLGGPLADRLGPARTASLVPLFYPLVLGAGWLARTPLELVFCLMLANLLVALHFPALVALLVSLTGPEERGRAFTLFEFCFATGTGAGALTGFVTLKRFTFGEHLLVAGIAFGLVGLVRLLLFSRGGRPVERPSFRAAFRAVRALDPRFLASLVLIQVLLGVAYFGPFYALYAKTDLGRPENEVSLLLGLGNLVATFGSLLLARILNGAGDRALALFVLMHAGFALPWLSLDFASGLPFFALAFLGGQLMLVSFQSILSRRVPERLSASVFGLVNSVGGIFLGLSPALFAFLAERFGGSRTPFHLAFAVALATAALLFAVRKGADEAPGLAARDELARQFEG